MIGAFKLNTIAASIAEVPAFTYTTAYTPSYTVINNTMYSIFDYITNSSFTVNTGSISADVLMVGGGGAGGGVTSVVGAGGGGAGGRVTTGSLTLTPQLYTINRGAGGTGVVGGNGNAGGTSSAFGFTALGGGGGTTNSAATNGGGSGSNSTTSFTSTVGTAPFKGGNSIGSATTTSRAGGGGGGAAGAGGNASLAIGGTPGIGYNIDAWWGKTGYTPLGTGGGGGGTTPGTATYAAAGATNGAGTAGSTAAGNGGGGARTTTTTSYAGGAGGSGCVKLKFATPRISSLNFVTSVESLNSTTITMPNDVQAGDLAILFDIQVNPTTTPTLVIPTGWTVFGGGSSSGGVASIPTYKILTGSEGGTTITGTVAGTTSGNKRIFIYRANKAITNLVIDNLRQTTVSAPTSQVANLNLMAGPFITLVVNATNGGTPFNRVLTVTPTREFSTDPKTIYSLYEQTTPGSSFSSTTTSCGDSGTNTMYTLFVTPI